MAFTLAGSNSLCRAVYSSWRRRAMSLCKRCRLSFSTCAMYAAWTLCNSPCSLALSLSMSPVKRRTSATAGEEGGVFGGALGGGAFLPPAGRNGAATDTISTTIRARNFMTRLRDEDLVDLVDSYPEVQGSPIQSYGKILNYSRSPSSSRRSR